MKDNGNKRYHNCRQLLETKNKLDYCPKCDTYVFKEGIINYESKDPKDIFSLIKGMQKNHLSNLTKGLGSGA